MDDDRRLTLIVAQRIRRARERLYARIDARASAAQAAIRAQAIRARTEVAGPAEVNPAEAAALTRALSQALLKALAPTKGEA